ncbi:class I SAM-dependent methyltransferase [Amycolatopsis tucumanensis]|uniref:class I SAM-dependent methyltransferase n=1 Tax=Amycolatopsis tucumanensis TaxID=401106 RepID=UPI003D71B70D
MPGVRFTEEQSTNLATLYGRALDARSANPLLGDTAAAEALERIDYDFGKFGMNRNLALSVAARAKVFDDLLRDFLRSHPRATVLHLGAGMDSRVFRLDPGPEVAWFDIDYPDVIALREQVYPAGRPGYRTIGSSVTDTRWLAEVPADRPAAIVAEGLTMYLDPDEGRAMFRAIVNHLPTGEAIFDAFSPLGIRLQKLNPVVRRSGARLRWGIADPRELEATGLEPAQVLYAPEMAAPMRDRASLTVRAQLAVLERIRLFREMGRLLRYRF